MINGLRETHYTFPKQTNFYKGKVRDVYAVNDQLVIISTDRISAFDHILPRPIPYKGQVLNQLSYFFLTEVSDIVPTWVQYCPAPNASVGLSCEPIAIEMVVRGYLAGHAWRTYKDGKRELCGASMQEGMQEGDPFDQPIITPSTKAVAGHDEDISPQEIIERNILPASVYQQMESYALALYQFGAKYANSRGLILVDTKYEFGVYQGEIYLIDEIHTPDSSRYYVLDGYAQRQRTSLPQIQLSKEFVREWLMDHGFMGRVDDIMPEMPDTFIQLVSARYIELYEKLTGLSFQKTPYDNLEQRLYDRILDSLYVDSNQRS